MLDSVRCGKYVPGYSRKILGVTKTFSAGTKYSLTQLEISQRSRRNQTINFLFSSIFKWRIPSDRLASPLIFQVRICPDFFHQTITGLITNVLGNIPKMTCPLKRVWFSKVQLVIYSIGIGGLPHAFGQHSGLQPIPGA